MTFSKRKGEMQERRIQKRLGAVFLVFLTVGDQAISADHTFQRNDLFAGVADGRVFWYDGTGVNQVFHMELNTVPFTFTTGMTFDPDGNLYVTNFNDQSVSKFDPSGNLLDARWAVTTTGQPESIVRDQNGDFYVSSAISEGLVHKFAADGSLIRTFDFNPSNVGRGGTDWMDLAADNCTMFWTVEENNIRMFDVCNDNNLGVFNVSPPLFSYLFALRILPDGGMLVANTNVVVRLDAGGNQIQTYDAPGEDFWFSLNLVPGCEEFWSGNIETGRAYRFDIESGTILEVLDTGVGGGYLAGLVIKGECLVCEPLCDQRTQGFWRRVCEKPHPEEPNGVEPYVDDVVALGSPIFDGFTSDEICDLMDVSPPENDMCRKARRQFMALLLNIASGRLTTCQSLTDGRSVQDAIDLIKSMLAAAPDPLACASAKTIADDLNNGRGLFDCGPSFSFPKQENGFFSKNSPNPFIQKTRIDYRIWNSLLEEENSYHLLTSDTPQKVSLRIYDSAGREVITLVDGFQEIGYYNVEWDGRNSSGEGVPSGVYFYRLQVGEFTSTEKLILLR